MSLLRRLQHRIAHLMKWNLGRVHSYFDDATREHMIGFRCDGCGEIQGAYPVSSGLETMARNLNRRAQRVSKSYRSDAALRGEGGYSPFGNSINAAVNGEGEKE